MIDVKNVTMKFDLGIEKNFSAKQLFISVFDPKYKKQPKKLFTALDNVSFHVERGEVVGLIGSNGAGKSTLLKVVSGVMKPTKGKVTVHGSIAPMIELGAGFDIELTARENIYLNGAVLGYSKKFIDEKFDEIVEFSELGEFIEVPVKNYSSGMKSRLGFSIATVVSPKILILDEVLSVGDARFRRKSEKKIKSMFDSGVTVLFVSHSLEQVKRLCNKAMILDHGKLTAYGDIDEVAPIYQEMLDNCQDETLIPKRRKKKKVQIDMNSSKEK